MKKQIQLDDAFDDEKEGLTDELFEALGGAIMHTPIHAL